VEHPRSSFLIYSLDFIAERFVYVLKPLISTAGGRFPRAWLEPPHSLCSLRGLKTHAIPAGVAAFRSNQQVSASN